MSTPLAFHGLAGLERIAEVGDLLLQAFSSRQRDRAMSMAGERSAAVNGLTT
jgi:hypothetical protein